MDECIPETLAGIQLVCDNDSPLHTKFTVKLQNGTEIVYNVESKREFIRNVVQDVIEHDATFGQYSV